jgi:hypothetical protein
MAPLPYETPDIRHVLAAQERGDDNTAQQIAAELNERTERVIAQTPAARMAALKENIARRERAIHNRRTEIQQLQLIPGMDEAVRDEITGKEALLTDLEDLNSKDRSKLDRLDQAQIPPRTEKSTM